MIGPAHCLYQGAEHPVCCKEFLTHLGVVANCIIICQMYIETVGRHIRRKDKSGLPCNANIFLLVSFFMATDV